LRRRFGAERPALQHGRQLHSPINWAERATRVAEKMKRFFKACWPINPHSETVGCAPSASKRLVFHHFGSDNSIMEIVFSVTQEGDVGSVAERLSHDIFTQGNTGEDLRAKVREAVLACFFDQPKPSTVRLHLVRDELPAALVAPHGTAAIA